MKQIKMSGKSNLPKGKVVFMLIFFLFTLMSTIFTILALGESKNQFIQKYFIAISVVLGLLLFGIFIFSIWCVFKEKVVISRILFTVYILFVFSSVLVFILQKTGFFSVIKDEKNLREYLTRAGALMPLLYVLLQYLQVTILPIPSIVTTLAGVALFGAFKACVYSLLGITFGSLTAFYIGRKWGNKAVEWMIGADVLKKWQNKLKGKDNLLLTSMFILPIFPDDILCFVAGLSSMSNKYFFIMIFISRLVSISATCYSFDFIPFNTWWGLLLWTVFIAIVIVAFILLYKNYNTLQQKYGKYFKKRAKKHTHL